jgi:hypothetical protein
MKSETRATLSQYVHDELKVGIESYILEDHLQKNPKIITKATSAWLKPELTGAQTSVFQKAGLTTHDDIVEFIVNHATPHVITKTSDFSSFTEDAVARIIDKEGQRLDRLVDDIEFFGASFSDTAYRLVLEALDDRDYIVDPQTNMKAILAIATKQHLTETESIETLARFASDILYEGAKMQDWLDDWVQTNPDTKLAVKSLLHLNSIKYTNDLGHYRNRINELIV